VPKLPNPIENFPRPPRLSEILKRVNPVKDVIEDARAIIKSGREEISSIVSALRVEGKLPLESTSEEATSDRVAEGTACELCSSEHFAQTSGDLAEALRFARSEGVMYPEVIKRVEHARQELNTMERYDLSPSEIQRLSGPERELANWALQKSRNLRHMINRLITTKEVSNLEAAAAEAETTAHEFTRRLWSLTPSSQECPECESLQGLREYLERRRRSHTTTKTLAKGQNVM